MSNASIKQLALKKLRNRWGTMIIGLLIYSAVNYLLSLTGFGSLLFQSILLIGYYNFILTILKNEPEDYGKIFSGFTSDTLPQRILLSVLKTIFIFLWSLLLFVPGIIKSYAYSLAEFISLKNPEKTYKECLDESQSTMYGHKMDLFIFDLSYILWYLAAILTCGLLLLYVAPYHQAARIEFINRNIYRLYDDEPNYQYNDDPRDQYDNEYKSL